MSAMGPLPHTLSVSKAIHSWTSFLMVEKLALGKWGRLAKNTKAADFGCNSYSYLLVTDTVLSLCHIHLPKDWSTTSQRS